MSPLPTTAPDAEAILRARARVLARPPQPAGAHAMLELLEFRVAGEHYALETRHVMEVLPLSDLASVPCTPAFVRGVVNVRGRITAVLDLQLFLQLGGRGLHDLHHVVLVRGGGLEFGLLADAVIGARALAEEALQSPPLPGLRTEYLRGMTAERLLVLDMERLLADPRIIVNEEVNP